MSFVTPLEFDPHCEHLVEVTEDIAFAGRFGVRSRVVGGSAGCEEIDWVFDELAMPGAVAAIGERGRGTGLEESEAGAGFIGDSERGGREVDGLVRNGREVGGGGASGGVSVGLWVWVWVWGEGDGGGGGVEGEDGEGEVVDGDEGVGSGTV